MKSYPYIGSYIEITEGDQPCISAANPVSYMGMGAGAFTLDTSVNSGLKIENIRGKTIVVIQRIDEGMGSDIELTLRIPGDLQGYAIEDIPKEFEIGQIVIWGTFSNIYEDAEGLITIDATGLVSAQYRVGVFRLP